MLDWFCLFWQQIVTSRCWRWEGETFLLIWLFKQLHWFYFPVSNFTFSSLCLWCSLKNIYIQSINLNKAQRALIAAILSEWNCSDFWPLTPTASEHALQNVRPGDQLRPAHQKHEGRRNRQLRVCYPNERRSQRRLPSGRWPSYQSARRGSLQPPKGAGEETGAAVQWKPGHRVHLLGAEQQHKAGWERPRLQQPQAVKAAAAQTGSLHHFQDQDVEVWWII